MSDAMQFEKTIFEATCGLALGLRKLERDSIRRRPIIGGVFGTKGYVLASWVTRGAGLDDVLYLVLDDEHGFIFCVGKTRAIALGGARNFVERLGVAGAARIVVRYAAMALAQDAQLESERQASWAAHRQQMRDNVISLSPKKLIPKRRQQVFAASNGECHYCKAALTIDGKWHIEHKMPKALMGGDEPENLVAACTSCNHKKRDMTDVEFKAGKKARLA